MTNGKPRTTGSSYIVWPKYKETSCMSMRFGHNSEIDGHTDKHRADDYAERST